MAYEWSLMNDAITSADRAKLARFILDADRFTAGPKVAEFEQEWNKWLGSKYSLFVSSGSTANSLLISAWKEKCGLWDGAKVILPACTWVTNVGPVLQAGLQPIFCDINLNDFSFDINKLKDIAYTDPDVVGIFVTHLLGYPAQVEKIREIFPTISIMEDVCESHGCRLKDYSRAGVYDVGGTFSFYFGHHMTTIEGGMVSTNDEELYDLMRMKRSHGLARESHRFQEYADQYPEIIPQFLFMTDGYNFRSTEINAVLGLSQLSRLDNNIDNRNQNYRQYHKLISAHPDLFYIPDNHSRISNFSFPFICRSKKTYQNLIKIVFKFDFQLYHLKPYIRISFFLIIEDLDQSWSCHTIN